MQKDRQAHQFNMSTQHEHVYLMRYNVDCPHCGKPRSLSDAALWPATLAPGDGTGAEYPEPSEPQECLDCHGYMRIVLDGDKVIIEIYP
jgi:hypothetical protein